ncbi:DUF2786 domain-containing protein [Salinispora vitiensis]|uniref:DUF2786 domain-containing protein n=1 Tax=Salinispora vitiensis TaxID=999544 RepID=UPI000369AF63|nr:DUF2786 domain-containing protein [Salinispora vitiensis]
MKLSREDYLRKVRALLAQAQDPATPPEAAENMTTKAMELMARHGIEVALAADAGGSEADPIIDHKMPLKGQYLTDMIVILVSVAEPLGIKHVQIRGRVRTECVMHLFGPASSIERADMLFTSLMVQCVGAMAGSQPEGLKGPDLRKWKSDFIFYFAAAVYGRLEAIEKQATDSVAGTGTDLVPVLSRRSAAVDERVKAMYPRLKRSRTLVRGRSAHGKEAGRRAGQRADIGQRTTSDGSRNALGH